MKVKCIANTGQELLPTTLAARGLRTEKFQIKIGDEYQVYAIALWKRTINYLTLNIYDHPFWHPADLFEIVDNTLPLEWYFRFFGYGENFFLNAIWGYKDLLDPVYYNNLLELDETAIRIFLKRKKEMDES